MEYMLKELSLEISEELYDMYQDIPSGENGQTNDAYGLNKTEFEDWVLNKQKE